MANRYWYYYLHTNGDIIGKSPYVVESDPDYFRSDFVRTYWKINLDDRSHAWTLCIEALDLGANEDRIKELIDKWGLTIDDSTEYLSRVKPSKEFNEKFFNFMETFYGLSEEDYYK